MAALLLRKIRKTVADGSLISQGDHVLVALSGGPDSVALLRLLTLLGPEYGLRLTAAHLNHGLRGAEARREEAFVRNLCADRGVECLFKTVDLRALAKGRGMSLEEIGREERYRFLDEAAGRCGAGKIATGHHRDDQAETVLINLLRGSGPEGLKGIPPLRDGRIIRPLLQVERREILEFLAAEGLAYMMDSSNQSRLFLRNRIRHELIPELVRRYNPRIVAALSRTADIVRREDDFLRQVVRDLLGQWGVLPGAAEKRIPLATLLMLHEALQRRLIKAVLESLAPPGYAIAYRHIEAVVSFARRRHGRRASLDLPGLIRVEKDGEFLAMGRVDSRPVRRDKKAKTPGMP